MSNEPRKKETMQSVSDEKFRKNDTSNPQVASTLLELCMAGKSIGQILNALRRNFPNCLVSRAQIQAILKKINKNPEAAKRIILNKPPGDPPHEM